MNLRGLIEAVRQRFCRHAWEYTLWQALIPDGRGSIVCTKCGKRDRGILRALDEPGEGE